MKTNNNYNGINTFSPSSGITEREDILAALHTFILRRPWLEYGNYGDRKAYRAEVRTITKQLHDARQLLLLVYRRSSITAQNIKDGFGAYSGRLSWDGKRLDYCTGQYWPTEYRAAVCAVMAQVLWRFFRDCAPAGTQNRGEYIRTAARRELGRSLARRFFN